MSNTALGLALHMLYFPLDPTPYPLYCIFHTSLTTVTLTYTYYPVYIVCVYCRMKMSRGLHNRRLVATANY